MDYIIFGLYCVLYIVIAFVGLAALSVSIVFTIMYLNPLWMLGMLITAVCVAACIKILDYVL